MDSPPGQIGFFPYDGVCYAIEPVMKRPHLQQIVRRHAGEADTVAAAAAIVSDLVGLGVPIDSRKGGQIMVRHFLDAARARALGNLDTIARLVCEDLARHTGWNLVRGGWFADDTVLLQRLNPQSMPG
jgi:hypothetical protein